MGRDARSILIVKENISKELIAKLKTIAEDKIVTEKLVGTFLCYDMNFRNTCLTENLEELENTGFPIDYLILEVSGLYGGFEWVLSSKENVSKKIIDTFYEPKASIFRQAKDVVSEMNIEDSEAVVALIMELLATDAC